MARLLLFAVVSAGLTVALPVAAQERRPETVREAGLRYLSWPGRPPVNARPARAERPVAPLQPRADGGPSLRRPEPTPQAPPQPQVQASTTPDVRPEVQRPADGQAPALSSSGSGARYYSVHRGSGRTPDANSRAQTLAAEETLIALQSPQGQSLAEQDRTARADEAFEILRNLPPDQLMDMLGRQP